MDIKWHGNTCFEVKGKTATLVINPDREAGKLKGDIVLSSLSGELAEVEGAYKVFDWPGEFEAKDVPIIGFRAQTKENEGDDTILFFFVVDGVRICHLGFVGQTLDSELIKKIGDVDVLMINAGKDSNLSEKKAHELIEEIEPRAIIAMGPGDPAEILKALGADKVESEEKFTLKSAKDLPEDKRVFVALEKA